MCTMVLNWLTKLSIKITPRHRSDILSAEREVAAAAKKVWIAIAALFPRFSLRRFVGDISTHVGSIFIPASATWGAGPRTLQGTRRGMGV